MKETNEYQRARIEALEKRVEFLEKKLDQANALFNIMVDDYEILKNN